MKVTCTQLDLSTRHGCLQYSPDTPGLPPSLSPDLVTPLYYRIIIYIMKIFKNILSSVCNDFLRND